MNYFGKINELIRVVSGVLNQDVFVRQDDSDNLVVFFYEGSKENTLAEGTPLECMKKLFMKLEEWV